MQQSFASSIVNEPIDTTTSVPALSGEYGASIALTLPSIHVLGIEAPVGWIGNVGARSATASWLRYVSHYDPKAMFGRESPILTRHTQRERERSVRVMLFATRMASLASQGAMWYLHDSINDS